MKNEIIVALAQINATVGALEDNALKMREQAQRAAAAGASLVVFPELAISGYPPEDLVLKKQFVIDCESSLARLAASMPEGIAAIAGSPLGTAQGICNGAVIMAAGKIAGRYCKIALPNYGVFDEKRVFSPGDRPCILRLGSARLGIHICEDSWVAGEPAQAGLQGARLDALVNISASPYHRNKLGERLRVLAATAARMTAPVLYCNMVGGQDELVFDGASMAVTAQGEVFARARQFQEDLLLVSLPVKGIEHEGETDTQTVSLPFVTPVGAPPESNRIEPLLEDHAEVYEALCLGLRDYVRKNGFEEVVVALSGGIDSALVATLAVDALGSAKVAGVTMPSQYSSAETRTDAEALARNLGIRFLTVPIKNLYDAYLSELEPLWQGRAPDITEENLQARIRGNIVMALSNKFSWLVLATGNKSELATGYCTLYGDMVGGFAVIKDVPKTLVFELARWRNNRAAAPVIPVTTIERAPSAELRPNQKDTDSLPAYEILDPIIEKYVEQDLGIDDIVAAGFAPETVRRVARLIDRSEYKRRQGAPGIKITPKAFGRDRRLPLTNNYVNHGSAQQ